MSGADQVDFTIRVKSPVFEVDFDDSGCCNSWITLLLRVLVGRKRARARDRSVGLSRRHSI